MSEDATNRSNLLNGPQGLRWDAQDMATAKQQRKQIAREFIINPARERWGVGWDRLSSDQREMEIQASFAGWVISAAVDAKDGLTGSVILNMWSACKGVGW